LLAEANHELQRGFDRAQETKTRMKDQAARVSRALCRARVVAEMHQRRGTQIAEHLKLVLSIIDRQQP
jgi:Tfp pilus assembly protein PilF